MYVIVSDKSLISIVIRLKIAEKSKKGSGTGYEKGINPFFSSNRFCLPQDSNSLEYG